MERRRIVEVYAAAHQRVGSGYLVSSDLVLTAGHVVGKEVGVPVEVRPLGTAQWLPAEVAWYGEAADAALLRLPTEGAAARSMVARVRWGEIEGNEPVPCTAVGFPWAQARPDGVRDTEMLYGFIAPATTVKAERYAVTVTTSPPASRPDAGSPWAGMSGAALFSGLSLVAVVVVDPGKFLTGTRIEASPVTALIDDGFVRTIGEAPHLVAVGSKFHLEVQPGLAVTLRSSYRPLPRAFEQPDTLAKAPAQLLLSDHGIVPFLGREAELSDLAAWLEDPATLAVRILTGRGGSGKSRLAAEASVRATGRGWTTGLVEPVAAGGEALVDRTLLVIDDAELHVELTQRLIERLAQLGAVVRVLLVSRRRGAWFEQLRQSLSIELDAFASEMSFGEDGLSAEERYEHFRTAGKTFATWLEREPPAEPVWPLAGQAFGTPLLLHVNALLACIDEGGTQGDGEDVRQRAFDRLLELEARRWDPLAKEFGLPDLAPAVGERAVAAATLVGAETEQEMTELLSAVPDFAGANAERLGNIARWLHELYPGTDGSYIVGLRPDLLAARHLARTVPDVPGLVVSLCDQAGRPGRQARLIAVLNAAASEEPSVRPTVEGLLEQRLEALLEEARATADPGLSSALATSVRLAPNPALAAGLIERLPQRSTVLAALAAELHVQAVDHYRKGAETDPDASVPALAASLNDLSLRLGDLGRREEALAAIEEAVALDRTLAKANPDAFVPSLATSLNNLSLRLGDLGRREEALAAIEEAVAHYRTPAKANPDAPLPDLAMSLNNLSNVLSDLGRPEEALAAIEESVARYQTLAEASSDAFVPNLAMALNNLSGCLSDLGRREEALAAIEESVAHYRTLAEANPDAFVPDLAMVLNNVSNRLSDLGRREEALAVIEESVAYYRTLAEANPDAFVPGLAMALTNLSPCLSDLGRREEALAVIEEAVAHYQTLAEANPDAFVPNLAKSLNNLSNRLSDLGRREEALAVIEEAVAFDRTLAQANPDAFIPDLARALNNLSNRLSDLGRREEALVAEKESAAIYRRTARPGL